MDLEDPELPGGYPLIVFNKKMQGKGRPEEPELSGGDFLIAFKKKL